jgi:hypothetical protein
MQQQNNNVYIISHGLLHYAHQIAAELDSVTKNESALKLSSYLIEFDDMK